MRGCRTGGWVLVLAGLLAAAGCEPDRKADVLLRGDPAPVREADDFAYAPIGPARADTIRPAEDTGTPSGRLPMRLEHAMPPAEPGWEPRVASRLWRWIVVHHSATDRGNAAIFDAYHRNGRHWDELGYHFVIGNGTESRDGAIEVGSRWPKQKHGAHCRVGDDQTYNQTGIGICLVGDFETRPPREAQMEALARLVDWLTARYRIPDDHVIGHAHVDDTTCPGRYFSMQDLRRRVEHRRRARAIALAGGR